MNPADIELRQIRHAIAVAEQGSLSGAAAQLKMSLSSLSRSIATLEKQLGATLFRRADPGIFPTDLGLLFIERGKAMVAAADGLDLLFGDGPPVQVDRVAVGMGAAMCEAATAAVAARMMTDWPTVSLELRSSFRDDLIPALRHGELDVLIADGSPFAKDGEFDVHPLPALPLVVLVRAGHPLAARPRFDMHRVFDHPVYAGGRIQPSILHELLSVQAGVPSAAARTRPMPAVLGSSVAMLLQMVEQTDCVTACSPALARQGVAAGRLAPLAAPPWMRSPYALVRPRLRGGSRPSADTFCREFVAAHEAEVEEAHRLIGAWLPQTDAG